MPALTSLSFLTPLALALSALAIPIILLYMLRLRRTEMPISSTFLWQQLVRDREANAPWQRLRSNLLLFLQLLILIALVLAMARPFSKVKTVSTGRIVLLLDASASMKATDVEPNRFAEARSIGLEMVNTLGEGDTMTVIQVSAVPEVLAAASRDRVVLRDAIRSARPGDVSADWVAALTLAASGAEGVDELTVVIVSDGGLPPNLPPVPGEVRYESVGRQPGNLSISALASAALPGQEPQLFAQISNYGQLNTDVIIAFKLNGSEVIETVRHPTVPAYDAGQIIAVRAADAERINSTQDLREQTLRVGVQGNTAGDNAAQTIADIDIVRYNDLLLAFQALSRGAVDAVIGDEPTAAEIIAQNPDLDVVLVGAPFTEPGPGYVDLTDIKFSKPFETVTAELAAASTSTPDYLAVDDVAFTVRDRGGAGRVLLVTEDNIFLQYIFRSLRGVEFTEIKSADYGAPYDTEGAFDLYVFDSWLPDELPDGDLLLVNPPSSMGFFQLGGARLAVEGSIMVNPALQDDPRVRNVDDYLDAVNKLDGFSALSGVDWATTLIQAEAYTPGDEENLLPDVYPLVVAGEVGNRQVAILPFDARRANTDLVIQPAWPILIAQLADWFSPPSSIDVPESLPPGAPIAVHFIEEADEALITRPNGQQTWLRSDGGEAVFAETSQPGLYRVQLRKDGKNLRDEQFAVNLFDPLESRISPRKSVYIGPATVSGDVHEETGRRELWPWVAGLGLVVLAVEWWYYHRSLLRIPRITLASWRQADRRNRGLRAVFARWSRRMPRPR